MPFISLNFYTKRTWKCEERKILQQDTVFLEQQIYASQKIFTQPLVVMVETFIRSAGDMWHVHVTGDTWQVTGEKWHVEYLFLSFFWGGGGCLGFGATIFTPRKILCLPYEWIRTKFNQCINFWKLKFHMSMNLLPPSKLLYMNVGLPQSDFCQT